MVLVSKVLQNKFLDKEKMKRNKERMKKKLEGQVVQIEAEEPTEDDLKKEEE